MSLLIRFFGVYSDGKIEQSLAVVTAHLPAVEISSVWLFHPDFSCPVSSAVWLLCSWGAVGTSRGRAHS